ncbi:MAG: DUF4831 family protein, partial [Bacteroidaceae bacterium]|nr:DUF4831 family protein [Bacteroidaceae bacterium]
SDGILLSINTEAEEEFLPELPDAVPAPKLDNPRNYMTQEMLAAGSTAKMAELCAEEIYDLRDSRNALIKGEADNTPKDGAQLQLMLNQLDKQTAALESMFKGTQLTSTEVTSFNFLPTQETDKEILFRFSKKLGFVDADDLAGTPYYISVKDQHTVILPDEKENEKRKIEGIVYNLPSMALISVFYGTRTMISQKLPIAQFGMIDQLAPTLFNKNTTTKVLFDTSTGALLDLQQ